MSVKIIFMGTPEFAVPSLKALSESKYEIISVYTQPPKKNQRGQKIKKSPIHLAAERLNIDVRTPIQLDTREEYDFFHKKKPNLVVVVAYGNLIPEKLLKIPKLLFINLHASLLPRWRGAAPVERAILNQDKETGVSIMKIVKGLDAGPYMRQVKVPINHTISAGELKNTLSEIGSKAILESIDLILKGEEKFIEQISSNSTYAKKIEKSEAKIIWEEQAEKIISKINAFNPKPGAWFEYNNLRYKIFKAEEVKFQGPAGEILDNNFTVGAGNNSIKILEIQKEGKNKLNVENFLIGNGFKKGTKLN